jgi:RNase P/RNase MRP subunit p30
MSKKAKYIDAYAAELPLDKLKELSGEDLHKWINDTYSVAVEAGYAGCAVTTRITRYKGDMYLLVRKFDEAVANIREEGALVFSRCHIEVTNQPELKRILGNIRRYCDLISVSPQDRQLMAFSSRDHRIDVISLPPEKAPPFFSGDIVELKAQEKLIEVTVSSLFSGNMLNSYRIRALRDSLKTVKKKNLKIIISTGPQQIYSPRDPRALISFAKIFLEIDQAKLSKDMSDGIYKRISENQLKRSGKIPVRGVEIEN